MPPQSGGTYVTDTGDIDTPGATYELASGTYAGFEIPANAVVYCEVPVTITSPMTFNTGCQFRGFYYNGPSPAVQLQTNSGDYIEDVIIEFFDANVSTAAGHAINLRWGSRNCQLRHFSVKGGKNHTIRFDDDDRDRHPEGHLLYNGYVDKPADEDGISSTQAGDNNTVLFCTFAKMPENAVDIKVGPLTMFRIEQCYFIGPQGAGAQLLIQSQAANDPDTIFRRNYFEDNGPYYQLVIGRSGVGNLVKAQIVENQFAVSSAGQSIAVRASTYFTIVGNRIKGGRINVESEGDNGEIGPNNVVTNCPLSISGGSTAEIVDPNYTSGSSPGW